MGKRFSEIELAGMQVWKSEGLTPLQIHKRLYTDCRKKRKAVPDLTTVRRALKGKTHQRSTVETRGRKRILTPTNLKRLDKTRGQIITKADNNYEVHWDDVIKPAVGAAYPTSQKLRNFFSKIIKGSFNSH